MNTELDPRLERADQLEDEAKEKTRQAMELRLEYAVQACPYSIGEDTTAKGYSYRGLRCQIVKIMAKRWFEWGWAVKAVIYNADGTLGKRVVEWRCDQELLGMQ